MDQVGKVSKFDYQSLNQFGKSIVEYVWIGGAGMDIRCKAKTYDFEVTTIEEVEDWNYDGSSTYQASTDSSEIQLKPVALFNDPFRGAPNKIVLCETYTTDGKPTISNFRNYAAKIFEHDNGKFDPWFGFEQEYTLMRKVGHCKEWPLGWPIAGYPRPQGPYYCSVGAENNQGREIMEAHYKCCLYAGVKIYGTNGEVMPGQWEFQIGTCKGIETADHLWMARYLLLRVAETFDVIINFDPKPVKGDWNGSGCHVNFSTNDTRNDISLKNINEHIEKLKESQSKSISLYGENNHLRLTGKHETSSMEKFTIGIANRGCSIRIPRVTEKNGRGYYEDRRPASNMDPYVVSSSLLSITSFDNFGLDGLERHYKNFIEFKKTLNLD